MNTIRILYHMARADFYERVRRYSFLITLGLVVYLGYLVQTGVMALYLDQYRGVFNSAWVGAMMTLVGTFFLGWVGFYVVKGSIARDYDTGVGQIIATTPLTRPQYLLGKWLSNLAVLGLMMAILAVAGIALQLIQREDPQMNLWALLSPFVIIGLPAIALTAALAALFDTVGWLRGGLGNVIYFFLFAMSFPAIMFTIGESYPAVEPLGMALLYADMGAAAARAFPDYAGGFSLGSTDREVIGTFVWPGVSWTMEIVAWRLAILAAAVLIVLAAAVMFDRFNSSKDRPVTSKKHKAKNGEPIEAVALVSASHIALSRISTRFNFVAVLVAELKLLLKGQRWWWYAGALILIPVGLFNDPKTAREVVIMLAWIWPVLIWSGMGSRESQHSTNQIVFSAARPLTRQLPATWLAGVLVAVLTGSGVGLRLLIGGDWVGLSAWLVGALFIPSLALACGAWSGSNKLFEVIYTVLWYIGPLNHVSALDYLGATLEPMPLVYLTASGILITLAVVGRRRQLQV